MVGMTDNPGGMESVVMNYYRHMDHDRIKFDFLSYFDCIAYQDELEAHGSVCYRIPPKGGNLYEYRKGLRDFFKTYGSQYDAVWYNTCSLANIDFLICAREYHIGRRIIHAHNSNAEPSLIRNMAHKLNRKKISKYATDFWSCSEAASAYFYDENIRKSPHYRIIQNAIDLGVYRYQPDVREAYRKQLGLYNCLVIGHVGRFSRQKNHMFLLDIFEACRKKNDHVKLLLIGQGELQAEVRERVIRDGVEKDVLFLGVRKDVPALLQAMDVFLFPSLFEGLPLALLEAQATGLPCITSEHVVPEETDITGLTRFIDLSEPAETWADAVLQADNHNRFTDYRQMISKKHFNIEEEAAGMADFFEDIAE